MTDSQLLTSPLHDRHVALGAKFAEFGGWSMPLEYATGVVKEHTAVRESVGIFDVSHLGKAMVTGPGAAAYVNATLSNDLGRIRPGKAQYTLCCDDATGGIVDDLIAYLQDDEHVLLVPNAANTAEVVRRLRAEAPEGVEVTDHHTAYAVLAVQGTKSDEVLDKVGLPTGHEYMSFEEAQFGDTGVVVCRTGYTGERGYELIARNEVAGELWDKIVAAGEEYGLLPAGLGARDTLRTEMGYPLHGQDISLDVTPSQGRVGWAVGPPPVIARLADIRQQIDFGMSPVPQWLVADLLDTPEWPEHLVRLRVALRARRDAFAARLTESFGPPLQFRLSAGGLHIWARWHTPGDDLQRLDAAIAAGVAYTPGRLYGAEDGWLRLGYSHATQDAAADAQDHRPVTAHQGREGPLVTPLGEAVQQLSVRDGVVGGDVEHEIAHQVFDDHPEGAGAGAGIFGFLGDGVERLFGEGELDPFHIKHSCVLLDNCIFRFD